MHKLIDGGHFFEGARWRDGAWWVSDVHGRRVWRIAPDGEKTLIAEVPERPSGLGWLPGGDMLIVSMGDRRVLRRSADGTLAIHADLSGHIDSWINDMLVDPRGNAYVGCTGVDLDSGDLPVPVPLFHIAPDGRVSVAAEDMLFPNGMVLASDGRTLIVAESLGNRLTAFTIGDDGSLSDRRAWATFGPEVALRTLADIAKLDVAPDGCAIDRDDCVWTADALHHRLLRIESGGRIPDEVRAPAGFEVHACALGGEDGRSLLICAAPDSSPAARSAVAEAALFIETVAVPAFG